MKLDKKRIRPYNSPLVSFTGDRIVLSGIVTLTVIAGTYPAQVTKEIDFLIVNCPSTYNIILGKPALNRLKAATSTYYLKVKFPTAHWIREIKGDQVLARECYQAALASEENYKWVINELEPVLEPSKIPQEVEIVPGDSTKVLKIGIALPTLEKENMISFLKATKMFSPRNKRICLRLIGRSYSIVSTSTQNVSLYSRSGEYLHRSTIKL